MLVRPELPGGRYGSIASVLAIYDCRAGRLLYLAYATLGLPCDVQIFDHTYFGLWPFPEIKLTIYTSGPRRYYTT